MELSTLLDKLFPKLKEIQPSIIVDESNSCNTEICLRLELEQKDVKPFLDYYSSISNTDWINYRKTKAPEK